MDKIFLSRNAVIRTKFGGYGRLMEENSLGKAVYIKKYTVFTVISFNLHTQTVLAVNQATKETVSLEYSFIIENCEIVKQCDHVVINAVAIVDTTEEIKEHFSNRTLLVIAASSSILALIGVLISTLF